MRAFITGATSGFGKAIAEKLAQEKFNLIITGRREDRLHKWAEELHLKYRVEVKPLVFDVRMRDEVNAAVASLNEQEQHIDVLVNNAGLALGKESIDQADYRDWDQMLDTNVKGILYVTAAVVPFMIKHKKGTIINVGSIAGKEYYPGGNVYSASKFAVDGLTKSMRLDFLHHGIRVGQIAPGAAETEFSLVRFKGDEKKSTDVYHHFTPLNAWDIAEAMWFMISRPPHVCINDMVIMPTAQAGANFIYRKDV